jgi:diguanylate cyclase (GGDEF)-like protein
MADQIALWRWSIALQLLSSLTIAMFFIAFTRDLQTPAVRRWSWAWMANLGAVLAADLYWFLSPAEPISPVLRFIYSAGKLLFLLLLVDGVLLKRSHARRVIRYRQMAMCAALFGVVSALWFDNIPLFGFAHQLVTVALCVTGAAISLQRHDTTLRWLGTGFVVRGALACAVGIAYAGSMQPPLFDLPWPDQSIQQFLAITSSFDTAAEWLLALGCILAVALRTRRALETSNQELLSAQNTLRALVDHDPLTGLANRRVMPSVLRKVQPHGAALAFVDLHDFKTINDVYGHQVGDATLKRFAEALRESFRPDDHLIRFAGDEFVVIAEGLSPDAITARLDALRGRLSVSTAPRIDFDAGVAEISAHGLPEEAIRDADDRMYDAKARAYALAPRTPPLGNPRISPVPTRE